MLFFENEIYRADLENAISSISNLENLKNKKILITGATGLIASVITNILRKYNESNAGIDLYLTSRKITKLQSMFGSEDNNLHYIETDLLDGKLIPNDVDYIIHSASVASPNLYKKFPVETVQSNVGSTLMLLNKFKNSKLKKFLFVSSGEVYGEANNPDITFSEKMMGVMDSLNVRSSYPISKLMSENLTVDFYHEYNVPTVIARPSHVYGPNYGSNDKRAASDFLQCAVTNKDIVIRSSGMQKRSFTYVFDAASGIINVLTAGLSGEAYNVSNTSESMTMRSFAAEIARNANVKFSYSDDDSSVSHAVLENKKLLSIGWKPGFTNNTGIDHSINIRSQVNNE